MSEDSYSHIQALLASTQPDEIREGLALVELEIERVGALEARPLFEMVAALFYIDPLDHPELIYILNEAVSLIIATDLQAQSFQSGLHEHIK